MKILEVVDACENTTAVGVVFQIVDESVHLIHLPLREFVFHAQLITIGLSDRSVLVRPRIPDVTLEILYVVGFFLPDPQKLIRTALDCGSPERDGRKFLSEIITVDNPEFLDGVGACPVLPMGTDFLSLCTAAVINNIAAHINKYLVSVTHLLSLPDSVIIYQP
jgi:hypothetical protein